MSSWFNTSTTIPEWKSLINSFEQQKTKCGIINDLSTYLSSNISQIPNIISLGQFLSNVTTILQQIKSYNTEATQFVRTNLPILMKESVRMVLELPDEKQINGDRTNKYPLQGLQFIEGLVFLPNLFTLNILSTEFYKFYCKCLLHYAQITFQTLQKLQNNDYYQNSLYKNYFFRLFEIPNIVVECQARTGSNNYASMTMSVASSMASAKKLNFLQCLMQTFENHSNLNFMLRNIDSQSILNCFNKMLMTNGMYNYTYSIKQYVLKQLFQTKKSYLLMICDIKNGKRIQSTVEQQKTLLQHKIQNIIELEFNIVNRSANIYDGIKLFELIADMTNIKILIQLSTFNSQQRDKRRNQLNLVPSIIQEHTSELLLSIVHRDNQLYKNASLTIQIQPKINLPQINLMVKPLILSLKQLQQSGNSIKPQIKHLNLVKTLYVMVLNRQKYDILTLITNNNLFSLLITICKNHYSMDILVNSIIDIFKSIFKQQVNLHILPVNSPNLEEFKNKNDKGQQNLLIETFKAADVILEIIKTMKSHKEPLFGQFFKLAKVIKEFGRNFLSTIDCSLGMSLNSSHSLVQTQKSSNTILVMEPMYLNEYIKIKSKQWVQFYKSTFSQLENNYLRDLGKFEQFQKAPQPIQTQYKITRFCEQKDITNSQIIHDKTEIEASMKNSIQILNMSKKQEQQKKLAQNSSLNFKKNKNPNQTQINTSPNDSNVKTQINNLQNKQQIEIISEPIKIQFKKKKHTLIALDSKSTHEQPSSSQGQQSFQNFMQKKKSEISTENRQNERKKSKTPPKFKSSDNKTPTKLKKWGQIQNTLQNNDTNNNNLINNTQLTNNKEPIQKMSQSSNNKKNLSLDDKLQRLKQKLLQNKLQPIKLIKVGNRVPKVYKQRLIEPNGRDFKLMQWIRI